MLNRAARDLVLKALSILGEFDKIQNGPKKYADIEEVAWKRVKMPQLMNILDDAYDALDSDQ